MPTSFRSTMNVHEISRLRCEEEFSFQRPSISECHWGGMGDVAVVKNSQLPWNLSGRQLSTSGDESAPAGVGVVTDGQYRQRGGLFVPARVIHRARDGHLMVLFYVLARLIQRKRLKVTALRRFKSRSSCQQRNRSIRDVLRVTAEGRRRQRDSYISGREEHAAATRARRGRMPAMLNDCHPIPADYFAEVLGDERVRVNWRMAMTPQSAPAQNVAIPEMGDVETIRTIRCASAVFGFLDIAAATRLAGLMRFLSGSHLSTWLKPLVNGPRGEGGNSR